MSVATNIVRSYRHPGAVIRSILDQGPREDRAIAYLMGACVLIFVAQWPLAARLAHLQPEVPLEARLGAALLAWVFVMPLVFYGLAYLIHLIAKGFGAVAAPFASRVAVFWTLLVVAPLMLLRGMVAGLIGPGLQLTLVDALTTVVFLVHLGAALRAALTTPGAAAS